MGNIIKLDHTDNVAVVVQDLAGGETVYDGDNALVLNESIPAGHKLALADIASGQNVMRYGAPIGRATRDIKKGDLVHIHNVFTNLKGVIDYHYQPVSPDRNETDGPWPTFNGYVRGDGRVGIRNEIWIIPTVFCVNGPAQRLASEFNRRHGKTESFDGAFALTHPCGCSQVGDDFANTQNILANLARHPNAGGVLILGLGCESNELKSFLPVVGEVDPARVKSFNCQDVEDEIETGLNLLDELYRLISTDRRRECPVADLAVAVNCGGSDAFSGITANPLVGKITDRLTDLGGTVLMTEVPEMFGAEQILMNRCENEAVFNDLVEMINSYKAYYRKYNEEIYKNPVPGNIAGGITTLEEKSLGCIQKAGRAVVVDVLPHQGRLKKKGFNLISGPGNDLVGITAQEAAGSVLTVFTTGRGTPTGFATPLLRLMSNNRVGHCKKNWTDYNAGDLLEGKSMDAAADELFDLLVQVANGDTRTKSESSDYRQIGLWRDGVTN